MSIICSLPECATGRHPNEPGCGYYEPEILTGGALRAVLAHVGDDVPIRISDADTSWRLVIERARDDGDGTVCLSGDYHNNKYPPERA